MAAIREAAQLGAEGPTVVFLGTEDDRHSRLAAALLRHRAGGGVRAVSMSPASVPPDPVVLKVMGDLGIDPHGQRCWPPSEELVERATLVVVMGYDDGWLTSRARRSEDWCIDDPNGKDPQTAARILHAIDHQVQRLLNRLGAAPASQEQPVPS
jgi:arsenate reductase (thioredoxin)